MRSSGILMHITSLPGPYGVGTLGKEAYRFVDFLRRAGQRYWQILPVGPTGYGDSPYQTFCTFAGNSLIWTASRTWACSNRRRSMRGPSAMTRAA